jgi:cobalt-zinc-cadmium efflux system membrane fusion protein
LAVRRHVKLGDEVKAGAQLVTLSSVEVSEAQGELAVAEQEWKRVESLGADAVSGRRYAEARIAVEQARAKARAYGTSGTSRSAASGEFTLAAPHAGRITEDAFVVGERIEPGRTLFRLVDERVVWIDATVPAEMARNVAGGSAATVVLGDARLTGTVLRQAHRTSEATRNAIIRIEVDNRDDRLHAGDYVDVYLESRGLPRPQISVPNDALALLEGRPVVFRQDAEGALEPVEVRTGSVIGDRTLIEEGLNDGDTVVVEGAFALKAQLLKAQLGEGHAH